MKTQVIAHAALLVVGALLSYLAWNREEGLGEEKAVVLAALEKKDIEEVRYIWPEGDVVITPLGKGDDLSWVATLTYVPETKEDAKGAPKEDESESEDALNDAGPSRETTADEAPKARVTERFPGGRSVERAMESFAPLSARRNLGKVAPERLSAMGLESPERTLVVKAKGKTWTFRVGDGTYGDQGRYAKLDGSDDVLLLDASAVRGLEGSPVRLMETRLVTLESEAVTAMSLTSGERKATFRHVEREQPKKRHFVHEDAPERRSEEASGLLSTVRGLRASKFVEKSALVGATPRATVTLARASGEPLVVTVYEAQDRSEHLVQAGPWLAEVPAARARNLLDDITAALPAE